MWEAYQDTKKEKRKARGGRGDVTCVCSGAVGGWVGGWAALLREKLRSARGNLRWSIPPQEKKLAKKKGGAGGDDGDGDGEEEDGAAAGAADNGFDDPFFMDPDVRPPAAGGNCIIRAVCAGELHSSLRQSGRARSRLLCCTRGHLHSRLTLPAPPPPRRALSRRTRR